MMNMASFPCRNGCELLITPTPSGMDDEAQTLHDTHCPTLELRAAREHVLTFSTKPGFVQALRRLERAALVAGPRSPEAAQAPFPPAATEALARGYESVLGELCHPLGLSGLYRDKCEECTIGVSCEEAMRCLFEG